MLTELLHNMVCFESEDMSEAPGNCEVQTASLLKALTMIAAIQAFAKPGVNWCILACKVGSVVTLMAGSSTGCVGISLLISHWGLKYLSSLPVLLL